MEQYRVSSRTVREGLAQLEGEGRIVRQRGRSAVVVQNEIADKSAASKSVAVIFQGRVRDLSSAECFDSLQQGFQREGLGTTLYVADMDPAKEVEIVNQLVREGVPGIVLFSAHASNSFAHLQAAQDSGTKIALLDHSFDGIQTNSVGIDDQEGGYAAAEHLIRLGCEELIFINWDRDWSTHTLRQRGFEMAVAKLGVASQVVKLSYVDGSEAFTTQLHNALTPILERSEHRLGIVAWNDVAALRAMDCLRDSGWSVPKDAAVVGFANDMDGALAEIPLTTMEIPREEISRMAVQLVVDQIRDSQREPQQIRFRPRLILRESCGCYPPLHEFRRSSIPHLQVRQPVTQ